MDHLIAPFVDFVLGSFVFVAGGLFLLTFLDELKQAKTLRSAKPASFPRPAQCRQTAADDAPSHRHNFPPEHAKAA